MKSFLLISLFLSFLTTITSAPVKVTFPSYDGPQLDVYSGYISVDDVNGRALHYILVKAETNPTELPLLVWYQGGPGCSGLIGLFQENGPFSVSRDKTSGDTVLSYNNLGWTQFANVLWVEQPAFVGFSYSNTSSDIKTSDNKSASDNLVFLEKFFSLEFPEFKGRKTWFTGESYGGVYVPMLSDLVVSSSLVNQFQGFMIGNPVFSCQQSGAFLVQQLNVLYWHGLASYTNYNNWTTKGCNDPQTANSKVCQDILSTVYDQIGVIDQQVSLHDPPKTWPSVDPDDIFQDFCTGNGTLEFVSTPTPDGPCDAIGDLVEDYLNRKDVQIALGVRPTHWTQCSNLDYNANAGSMIPYYQDILKRKPDVSLLIYSGDLDILTIPFAYTQPCIPQIGGTLQTLWQPWFVNGATAGYYEEYEYVTYATVKGAGHEAPQYQPVSSYQLIYRYLTTGSLSSVDPLSKGKKNGKGWRKERLTQSKMLRKVGVVPGYKQKL